MIKNNNKSIENISNNNQIDMSKNIPKNIVKQQNQDHSTQTLFHADVEIMRL